MLNWDRDYSNSTKGVLKGINSSETINNSSRTKSFSKFNIRLSYTQTGLLAFATIVKTSSKPILVDEY